METLENEKIEKSWLKEKERLSVRTAQSLENDVFWLCLAARKSYMFDEIYWTFLDKMFFGPRHTLDDRLLLLTQSKEVGMEYILSSRCLLFCSPQ